MIIKPFRAVRPRPELAAKIPSYPYDVLDSSEARRLAEGDPYTFLHVEKPEIDLEPSISLYDDRVYEQARRAFRGMLDRGWLQRDARPAYYVYRLIMRGQVQWGLVGVAAVDDYLDGRIKRHEYTRRDKEDDRTRHAEALGASAGPAFLAYRPVPAIDAAVEEAAASAPAADFRAPDGIQHTLWIVDEPGQVARLEALLQDVPASYIADGHHRTASYARIGTQRRASTPGFTGREPFNFFLAVHFPSNQLRILDYNRLVKDLRGLDLPAFLAQVRGAGFEMTEDHSEKRPPRRGTFGMYAGGRWRLLMAGPAATSGGDPVRRLDVSILMDRLLGPVLGIGDPRTDKRIDFVGGIRGMEELERRVDSGEHAVAFSLFPTGLDDVMAVADAGLVMPPKSTWFEPKLRSGLVIHLHDGDSL